MILLARNILKSLKEVPLFYREAFKFTYKITKEYGNGSFAKNLSQANYEADESVNEIILYMGYTLWNNPKKETKTTCAKSQILFNLGISQSYKSDVALQVPKELFARLCGTSNHDKMKQVLESLKHTPISKIKGCDVLEFRPIWDYSLEDEVVFLYPSIMAYDFLSNQDVAPLPVEIPEIKDKGGRPKDRLYAYPEFIEDLMGRKRTIFFLSVPKLRKYLHYEKGRTTDFIKKIGKLCDKSNGALMIEGRKDDPKTGTVMSIKFRLDKERLESLIKK